MNAIAKLESWKNKEKCRSVSIAIDNGYGACCWTVVLNRSGKKVSCSECNFFAIPSVDHRWYEQDGNLYTVVCDGDEMDDWPGLEATILRALECAELFWKDK
jgi:hypothetical protein